MSKKQEMISTGTVVLITGANQGIGLALAKVYSRPNHVVIGTCRDLAKAEALIKAGCKVVELDVSSDESCAELPKRLAELGVHKVDVLINNAGVLKGGSSELSSPTLTQDFLDQVNTNALGPLRVSIALLPMLRKAAQEAGSAKIANISSRMGSVTDNTSGGYYGYRASKAAENMVSVSLARDLAKDNILSLVLHPGYISTRMVGHKGDMDPDTCAPLLAKVIDNASKDDCFKFFHRDGFVLPW